MRNALSSPLTDIMKIDNQVSRRSFLGIAVSAALIPGLAWPSADVPSLLDHFILGCDDLDRGIDFVEKHTGVCAAFGGIHPGPGPHTPLLSLPQPQPPQIIPPDPPPK